MPTNSRTHFSFMEKGLDKSTPIELRMKLSDGGQLFYLQYRPKGTYTETKPRFFGLIKRVIAKEHVWRYVSKYSNSSDISAYNYLSNPDYYINWHDEWYYPKGIEDTLASLKRRIQTYGDLVNYFNLEGCQKKYEADLKKWNEEVDKAKKRGPFVY